MTLLTTRALAPESAALIPEGVALVPEGDALRADPGLLVYDPVGVENPEKDLFAGRLRRARRTHPKGVPYHQPRVSWRAAPRHPGCGARDDIRLTPEVDVLAFQGFALAPEVALAREGVVLVSEGVALARDDVALVPQGGALRADPGLLVYDPVGVENPEKDLFAGRLRRARRAHPNGVQYHQPRVSWRAAPRHPGCGPGSVDFPVRSLPR